jgi:hypothetical protein
VRTLTDLNRTALAMVGSFDPTKYADQVKVYQELVEKNAAAALEDARRVLQRESEKTQEQTQQEYENALRAGFQLLAYIPPDRREQAIGFMHVPKEAKEAFLKVADRAPDFSVDFRTAYKNILEIAANIAASRTRPPSPPPPTLRPPTSP